MIKSEAGLPALKGFFMLNEKPAKKSRRRIPRIFLHLRFFRWEFLIRRY